MSTRFPFWLRQTSDDELEKHIARRRNALLKYWFATTVKFGSIIGFVVGACLYTSGSVHRFWPALGSAIGTYAGLVFLAFSATQCFGKRIKPEKNPPPKR
ncbi:MAG TPA: hypothetical protein VF438_01115 [Candidatus Paceibacterota bacterium]